MSVGNRTEEAVMAIDPVVNGAGITIPASMMSSQSEGSVMEGRGVSTSIGICTPQPVIKDILDYTDKKLGQTAMLVVLCKLISVASTYLTNGSNCPMIFIAPSSSWKSRTSAIVNEVVTEGNLQEIQSETWKGFMRRVGSREYFCILADDMTRIAENRTSKEMREIKEGLTGLLTEKTYRYTNMAMEDALEVKASGTSAIINMVPYTYKRMVKSGINSTFFDRFLRLHYTIPPEEKKDWLNNEDAKRSLRYNGKKIHLEPFQVELPPEQRAKLQQCSEAIIKGYKGLYSDRLSDYLLSIAKCNAHLYSRSKVTDKDVYMIEKLILKMLHSALSIERQYSVTRD